MIKPEDKMNGWKTIAMWSVGSLFTLVAIVGIPFLIKEVIANDRRNTVEHTAIRTEFNKEITEIKQDIREITTNIKWIAKTLGKDEPVSYLPVEDRGI
jgi:hypothetical protein